jgi:subtilisin
MDGTERHRWTSASLICAVALVGSSLGLSVATPAVANPDHDHTRSAEGRGALNSAPAIASGGRSRVIVELETPHVPEGRLSATDRSAQRRRIADAQDALRGRLHTTTSRQVRAYKSVPFVALDVDEAGWDLLRGSDEVASVQPDRLERPALATSTKTVGADDMVAGGADGRGRAIAVLDTGIAASHATFTGRVVDEACFSTTTFGISSSTCPNGGPVQTGSGSGRNCSTLVAGCNHGTHVAGIAAGADGTHPGVAAGADLVSIQVFTIFNGTTCSTIGLLSPCLLSQVSDQLAALEHVYTLRNSRSFAAVNMSLGGGFFSSNCDTAESARKAVIDNLLSVGIATVVASGNDASTNGVSSPGCISSAVTVGSTSKSGTTISWYTNNHRTLVDLLAPGEDISSSVPGGTFKAYSGTSMAAPHVAGAFAVLQERSPSATIADILGALETTGYMVNDPWASPPYTNPRIKVFHAATALGNCPDDSAEDDDTRQTSRTIEMFQPKAGIVCPGDTDHFSVVAGARTQITVVLDDFEPVNGDLDVFLEGESGTLLAVPSEQATDRIIYDFADGGTYYLRVQGADGAHQGYGLSIFLHAEVKMSVRGKGTIRGGGVGAIVCPTDCLAYVLVSREYSFLAEGRRNWRFDRWQGACRGQRRRCELTLTKGVSARAVFVPKG